MALPIGVSPSDMLHRELMAQGLPVLTVTCGSLDRSTWVIQLAPNATAQQIAQAESIRLIFDPENPITQTTDKIRRRDKTLWTPQILALTRAVHQRLRDANVDNMTMGIFRGMVETEYDAIN